MGQRITLIGAGAWGTALAMAACRVADARDADGASRPQVRLHVRDAQQAERLRAMRENARYLPGLSLPPELELLSDPLDPSSEVVAGAQTQDLFIVATPMAGLRSTLTALAQVPSSVAWLCKGFEAQSGRMPHEVQAEVAPLMRAGVLSGPSFAQEVASGQPAALDYGRTLADGALLIFVACLGLLLRSHETAAPALFVALVAATFYGAACVFDQPTQRAAAGLGLALGALGGVIRQS